MEKFYRHYCILFNEWYHKCCNNNHVNGLFINKYNAFFGGPYNHLLWYSSLNKKCKSMALKALNSFMIIYRDRSEHIDLY